MPVPRQAELLVRVAAYDRNLPARAGGTVRVLVLVNPDDADSRSIGAQMVSALRKFDKIAGLPHDVSSAPFASAAQLASACKAGHISIVYVAPGLDDKIGELVAAMSDLDLLSVAALARHVNQGIVLGFDLISAKPTLVINLVQAKKQNVSIDAGVLNLMKVVP